MKKISCRQIAIYMISRLPLFKKATKLYSKYCNVFGNFFTSTPSNEIKSFFNLPKSDNSTQLNQDIFALVVNKFSPGYFIEIGANDGFNLSNTLYLEEHFNWTGLLIEANPRYLNSLKKRRALICNKGVAEKKGSFDFLDAGLYGGLVSSIDTSYSNKINFNKKINVECSTLEEIFKENNVPSRVSFLSIDVEGGEKQILVQACMLTNYRFTCGVVEHNYRNDDICFYKNILEKSNYRVISNGNTGHDLFFIDELYDIKNLKQKDIFHQK
jgi:FkbM family methyltransferase